MERPESLEEQASQEGFVPEFQPDEEPADDSPVWDEYGDERNWDWEYDISDPYDKEYDVP